MDMEKRTGWLAAKDGSRFEKAFLVSLVAGLALPSAAAAPVRVVKHFPADRGPGYRKPYPDAAGAVGPKHTAVLDDRAFVVQDKTTGRVLRNDTQHDFWLKVLQAGTFDLQAVVGGGSRRQRRPGLHPDVGEGVPFRLRDDARGQ